MGKPFPLQKGVACQLKWTWNTLRLAEATSACCHRVTAIPLTAENFDNFHNDPIWVSHREMQLEGKFPQQGCQYCEKIEAQGGTSDRILHATDEDVYPIELDGDPEATVVSPRILEIFINNACNLACIYCDESNSSRIHKENKKFGYDVPMPADVERPARNIIPILPKIDDHNDLVEKFFIYLDNNYHYLRRLQVLGGEPFYQKEFFSLTDHVANNKNSDLTFNVVTNLMVSRSVLEAFVEKMKKALIERRIARVDITASIDCWGAEQEYVRYGIDLGQWRSNFEYLLSHKWIYMSVNNTITSLTIKTLPDLLVYINDLRKTHRIHHAFGIVDGRSYLHPGIMGPNYWTEDFNRILELMPRGTLVDNNNYNYMSGIAKALDSCSEDLTQQRYLKYYLDEIDRRRSLNWRGVFPWLSNKLNKINVVQ